MVTLERTLIELQMIVASHKLPPKPAHIRQEQSDYGAYLRERVVLNLELYECVKKNYPAIDKFSLNQIPDYKIYADSQR